jgi:hypothetical protein
LPIALGRRCLVSVAARNASSSAHLRTVAMSGHGVRPASRMRIYWLYSRICVGHQMRTHPQRRQ